MFKLLPIFKIIGAALLPAMAQATGGVDCRTEDGQAEISIGMHRVIIYSPMDAFARLGNKKWKGIPVEGEIELGSSQGILSDTGLQVEFADREILKIIIRLNVDLIAKETENGYPGTLTFEDGIERIVYCVFE